MIKKYNINLYKNKELDKSYKDIKGLKNQNCITLILDDVKTIIKDNELIRENNEFKFNINLKTKESKYLLKEHNLTFKIEVIESNIEIKEKEIIINYLLETNEELITITIIESV